MESFKKFLPFVLIAVIFVLAGYFIGKNTAIKGDASVYHTNALSSINGNGSSGPSGIISFDNGNGGCVYWILNNSTGIYREVETKGIPCAPLLSSGKVPSVPLTKNGPTTIANKFSWKPDGRCYEYFNGGEAEVPAGLCSALSKGVSTTSKVN